MSDSLLIRCERCLLPETHETIVFDSEGICNICRNHEAKRGKTDWDAKYLDLESLLRPYRGDSQYHCIVPFSGGKDSTFTLYYVVKVLRLRPLVVTFDHGFLRPTLIANRERTLRKLGVDFQSFRPSWHLVRRLMLQAFLEKGDFCWHCHTGIGAYPVRVAVEKGIPLIIMGEPSSEYTAYFSPDQSEEGSEERFNKMATLGLTSSDMFVRLGQDIPESQLTPFSYPPSELIAELGLRTIFLGSYIPWDTRSQSVLISEQLEWQGDEVEGRPKEYPYEKIECWMQGVRDYIKYLKRGYTRPSHLAAIDLRNSKISREEAMTLVRNHEGKRPASLDLFLDYVGLTESEFLEVVQSHSIDPWAAPEIYEIGPKPRDFGSWSRGEGVMPAEASRRLESWRKSK